MSIKKFFFILVLFGSIGPVSSDLYLPSLPSIVVQLHTTISLAQLTVAIFILGLCFSRLFFGLISDAFGRKTPILISLVICIAGTFICLLSSNIYILLVGRLIQGFGAGGSNIIARIMLRDRLQGNNLAEYLSYYSMAGITLMASSPLLGGYLEHYFGWHSSFMVIGIYALIALMVGIFVLPETNQFKCKQNLQLARIKTNIKTLFHSQAFLSYAIILGVGYGCMLAWLTSGPIVLQKVIGLTPVEFGWVAGMVGFSYFTGAYLNGKLVSKFGIQPMIKFGTICLLFSGALMLFAFLFHYLNAFVFVIPVMIAIFGLSFTSANAFAVGMQPFPKIAGIAVAICQSSPQWSHLSSPNGAT